MTTRDKFESGLGWAYGQITGEEDARVCKDIPDSACADQPRNFFTYLVANFLNKISDELVSSRLTLPWLFSLLGVPASFTGFLVPIRESSVLLPQLFVAARVRAMPQRKVVWLVGAAASAISLFIMGLVAIFTSGVTAGWLILSSLIIYSLARGLCSVSAKDVVGKTISKTRRGRLMGYSASLAGLGTLAIGLMLQGEAIAARNEFVLYAFIFGAALLWLLAFWSFRNIIEPDGATEGGGNAITEAFRSLRILIDDRPFQHYVISRALLLSVALVVPFYVLLVQQHLQGGISILGWLIIANGLAGALSAPLVGRYADSNSRAVMVVSAMLCGTIGVLTFAASTLAGGLAFGLPLAVAVFFLVNLAHGAVRLGRKVYLIDMANQQNRSQYVAVSNTVIGFVMLLGGLAGVLADIFNVQFVILVLSIMAIGAGLYIQGLDNVSG